MPGIRGFTVALLSALAVALLTAAASSPAAAPGTPCAQSPQPGDYPIALQAGGLERTALLHIPPDIPAGTGLPLLIALHGAKQNAAFFAPYTGYSEIADVEHFAVLYPNAWDGYWTIGVSKAGKPDDVAFISQLLDYVSQTTCLDPTRVYATGVSNGGGMAARLGCDLSTRIAAIAPVAGGYGSLPPCHPVRPVSVFEVHGTEDGVVPYATGPGAVRPYVHAWVVRDRCPSRETARQLAPQVVQYGWSPCAGGSQVAHLEIYGGAHQLPGGLPSDNGQDSTFSAPWMVWRFVSRQRLAPEPTR